MQLIAFGAPRCHLWHMSEHQRLLVAVGWERRQYAASLTGRGPRFKSWLLHSLAMVVGFEETMLTFPRDCRASWHPSWSGCTYCGWFQCFVHVVGCWWARIPRMLLADDVHGWHMFWPQPTPPSLVLVAEVKVNLHVSDMLKFLQ